MRALKSDLSLKRSDFRCLSSNLASTVTMLSRLGLLTRSCSQAARNLSSSASVLAEGEVSSSQSSQAFANKVAELTNNEPSFPADFLKKYGAVEVGPSDGPTPSKIKLSFASPHKILMSNSEVRIVHRTVWADFNAHGSSRGLLIQLLRRCESH